VRFCCVVASRVVVVAESSRNLVLGTTELCTLLPTTLRPCNVVLCVVVGGRPVVIGVNVCNVLTDKLVVAQESGCSITIRATAAGVVLLSTANALSVVFVVVCVIAACKLVQAGVNVCSVVP